MPPTPHAPPSAISTLLAELVYAASREALTTADGMRRIRASARSGGGPSRAKHDPVALRQVLSTHSLALRQRLDLEAL